MAKRKKAKRVGAAKWSAEERLAWLAFLQGEILFPPASRSIGSVVSQMRGFRGRRKARGPDVMPSFDKLPEDQRHAMSLAAYDVIGRSGFVRDGLVKVQVEQICRIASGDIAFMIEKPEEERAPERAGTLQLFSDEETAPIRMGISDLPDEKLHAAIIATRAAMRNTIAPKRKKRAA